MGKMGAVREKDREEIRRKGHLWDATKRSWQADRVLDYVRAPIETELVYQMEGTWHLENFDNGRERGYRLSFNGAGYPDRVVAWAENRNSDSIVLYPWNVRFTDRETKRYPDDCEFFKPGQFKQVAARIFQILTGQDLTPYHPA